MLWNIIVFVYVILAPAPNVSVSAPNTQTVGQSLTLQCNVTTVRGITSRVDIVWSSGGTELQRMNDVSSTTMDNSLVLVYTDSYTISQLSTTDEGRVIQCEVVINASPPVMASDSITLDVTGEYIHSSCVWLILNNSHQHANCYQVIPTHCIASLFCCNTFLCTISANKKGNLRLLEHVLSLLLYILNSVIKKITIK